MDYWIGLGSNVGDGVARIEQALARLDASTGCSVLRRSSFYRNPPWGYLDQADFINTVALVRSERQPLELLHRLQAVERGMGRMRGGPRWGPRVIDLDILLAGDRVLHLPRLTVPHRMMHRRAFVLVPMAELEPDLQVPARGRVSGLLQRLPAGVVDAVTKVRAGA